MRIFSLLVVGLAVALNCYSQDAVKQKTSKVAYGEVLSVSGPTVFTGNFDMRFKGQKGFGAHAGFGVLGSGGGGSILIIPFGINYLFGKSTHFVEGGLGSTILTIAGSPYITGESVILIVPSAGYRYQPTTNGISVRVFISPWVIPSGGAILAGGLSLGYKF
ncbi:MAG: hypothetical protein ABIR19_00215 [Ginsengibacter sp.]